GYAIAEALAKRKYDLVLIARHQSTLEMAKEELEMKYGVKVSILICDLSREDSAEEVASWCMENNIPLNILCNSVGIGGTADYLSSTLEEMQFMVRLNIESG